jgi:hypothetical protein
MAGSLWMLQDASHMMEPPKNLSMSLNKRALKNKSFTSCVSPEPKADNDHVRGCVLVMSAAWVVTPFLGLVVAARLLDPLHVKLLVSGLEDPNCKRI